MRQTVNTLEQTIIVGLVFVGFATIHAVQLGAFRAKKLLSSRCTTLE